ncbi:hypothetical protein P775_11090 [Puniceibacterium antarcticum]|uniref:DUF2190 domain-containing protein n=1 Tax=Puniceibacterium antarcticum TaxID=1206336 RepID=A0A2G8RF34_9RHOB|nr:capsid cement protein [Puniceibacterium antarcticum]PIL20206.1 hypothetical protein P775_11090 [Puniceibacterium antarcticum]
MMTYQNVLNRTVTATSLFDAGDLISYAGAKITTDDTPVLGVALNPCTEIGQDIAVLVMGSIRIKATGAVTAGAKLISSSGGGVKVAVADPASANVFATALTAAADGAFLDILIR